MQPYMTEETLKRIMRLEAENQRLRELLERARALHSTKLMCDCDICELHKEIDEELNNGAN